MLHSVCRSIGRLCAYCLLLFSFTPSMAQKTFTLDDLMWGGTNYWKIMPRGIYTAFWNNQLVERSSDEVRLMSNAKGQLETPTTLFTAAEVEKAAGQRLTGLSLYQVSFPFGAAPLALISTPKQRLVYNWETQTVEWTQDRPEGAQAEDFAPTSRALAFVKDHNLYLRTADGQTQAVSKDGSHDLVYGESVHQNEFGYEKGTFFSPSGRLLCFTRMDQSMVGDYPQVNIFTREATCEPQKYPMAGMAMHKVTLGIYNADTHKTVYLQAGDPTDRYFTNPSWSPDEQTLYLIEMPRSQQHLDIVAYDAQTGQRKGVIYSESNDKYVHPVHGLTFLPWDSSKFIYQSEKDGYNHLYLMDTHGHELRQLTEGPWVVLQLAGFDTKRKKIIIQSTENTPLGHSYYAVDYKSGARTLLDNGKGTHRAALSQDGSLLFDQWSAPEVYRSYDLVNVRKQKRSEVRTDANPWSEYAVPEIAQGSLKAADDSTTLFYRMVKPVDFDPNKKYPTVVYVYGGPGVRCVRSNWNYSARPWEIFMAQKGYLVFVLDNRGSSERGFEFETATYHHLGTVETADQMKGIEYLQSLPYVDAKRIGVHGWSFGGFMTTTLMTTHPEVFKVGVAGGPVIDWKYYEVMYGERYMGRPQDNPEGYRESSLLNKAQNLQGRLQIIIGYNDPVCVPQHSLSFLRQCADVNTQPDFFCYPGQGHNMSGKDMVHLHERITRYFDDFLRPLK